MPQRDNRFRQFGKSIDGTGAPLRITDVEEFGAIDDLVCEIVDDQEILWICGKNGIIRVNTTVALPSHPAAVGATVRHRITTSSGLKLSPSNAGGTTREIEPSENSLRFRFGTPGLAGEPDSQHLSRLLGFVDSNEETSRSGERTFTKLP